jgi:tetratricopeptide (TPR) repeat protein
MSRDRPLDPGDQATHGGSQELPPRDSATCVRGFGAGHILVETVCLFTLARGSCARPAPGFSMRIPAKLIPALIAAALLLAPSLPYAHDAFDRRVALASARIEDDSSNAGHYIARSILYRDHGDFEAALTDLERAAQLEPLRRELGLLHGRLYLAWGQPERALRPLERSLEKRQDQPAANAALARVLSRLGRPLEAADRYTLAIDQTPRASPDHYLERARALCAAGEEHYERALRGLDAGMERLGPVAALAMLAIEIELDLGQFDSALARVDRLADRSARQETWLAQRGEILELAQRPLEARASYSGALGEIQKLPAQRRRTPAMSQLQSRARAGLARLASSRE